WPQVESGERFAGDLGEQRGAAGVELDQRQASADAGAVAACAAAATSSTALAAATVAAAAAVADLQDAGLEDVEHAGAGGAFERQADVARQHPDALAAARRGVVPRHAAAPAGA